MKKIIYAALIACTIGSLFTACKKHGSSSNNSDSDNGGGGSRPTLYPKENPLKDYLDLTKFKEKVDSPHVLEVEQGLVFTPQVTGSISAVTFQAPESRSTAKITLWDAETKKALKTITISNVKASKEIEQLLDTALLVTKDHQYAITFSANGHMCYERTRTNGSAAKYPVTVGNIQIDRFAQVNGGQSFPTSEVLNKYVGDCSFVFRRTEQ
jgi:hypothetical protein